MGAAGLNHHITGSSSISVISTLVVAVLPLLQLLLLLLLGMSGVPRFMRPGQWRSMEKL